MANPLKALGKSLLGVAPTLATALLPGVGGVIAGSAVKAISAALGTKEDPVALAKVLDQGLGPEALKALRAADQEFEVRMKELDVDLSRIHQHDRASARRMQVQARSWVPGALSLMVVVAFLGLVSYVCYAAFHPPAGETQVDPTLMNLVFSVVSYAAGAATTVLTFWFGSSQSGEDSNAQLAEAAKGVGK